MKRYKPHSNKQQALLPFIKVHGETRGWSTESAEPTLDPGEMTASASDLLKQPPPPLQSIGQAFPAKIAAPPSEQLLRSPQVLAWVLREAAGRCECCGNPTPFKRADGDPNLEVHHLRWLANDGRDTVPNAVAVCRTCHRLLHDAAEGGDAVGRLYASF
ncbi:HNH endonuclease [Vulgatibacter incomptus]|uniref:HNH endonuclease n=1 Tax=Vulgatibacter incomptus TaxID=1391653 RepID=UPI0009EC0027|nr:HNH endonuclease signature motif containing protein [Vulgatibacter incomptus]